MRKCIVPNCTQLALPYLFVDLCDTCADGVYEEYGQLLAARQREVRRQLTPTGWVYFMQVGDRVKVGFTRQPRRRLRQYPPGSTLLAAMYGATEADEKLMHGRLTQFRDAGREWYRSCPGVHEVVAEVVAKYGEPKLRIEWGNGRPSSPQSMSTRRNATVVGHRFS